MASKAFNSAGAPADTATPRQVAADARRVLPAAVPSREVLKVLINVKAREDLALALAQRAEAEGGSEKQVITRTLAAAGLPVDPSDLEDRIPRRRFVA